MFTDRSAKKITIVDERTGNKDDYFVEEEIPFDSTRKRMSLLI